MKLSFLITACLLIFSLAIGTTVSDKHAKTILSSFRHKNNLANPKTSIQREVKISDGTKVKWDKSSG